MSLATRFANRSPVLRSSIPLTDDQIFNVAPSIFAEDKHASRSERYTYIPTIEVLRGLRREGFQPFFVCQTRVRDENQREHTKHMLRLRHAGQINDKEANEIILINSHNGTSSYQMLSGLFRFVCQNGMVCGNTFADVRIPHKGDITGQVIEGAFTVLDDFEVITEQRDAMRGLTLNRGEQNALAHAALLLKYDDEEHPAPITEEQLLMPRRFEDVKDDLWTTFNILQENLTKGGLSGRNVHGKRTTTRAVTGIDQDIKLNRALSALAESMRQLKA